MTGKEELVKEVIGLANATVRGPRHVLFGINPGAIEGSKIVGMSEDAIANLKKAHRHVSVMIDPPVSLAFIFDEFGGKLVGALEINECGEGPFVVAQDYSRELEKGKCWIRDGRDLRAVDVAELTESGPSESTDVNEPVDDPRPIEPVSIPLSKLVSTTIQTARSFI